MSIETLLSELKESIDRNTEALLKGASAVGTATGNASETKSDAKADKPAKGKTEKKEEGPKITQEQMNAALIKIKDHFGMEHAKGIITEVGKAAKMADIKPAQYQAVYDAAVAKHAELTAEAEGGESEDL